jgi:hypothetical protein
MITKKMIFVCFLSILWFTLSSCGISKDEMQQGIMKKQQETFDTNSFFKEFGLTIQDVTLLKTGYNTYDGIITVLLEEEEHNISITVKTDSDTYMWQIDESSLQFLINYKMRNLRY